jgi:hypothetical protein
MEKNKEFQVASKNVVYDEKNQQRAQPLGRKMWIKRNGDIIFEI